MGSLLSGLARRVEARGGWELTRLLRSLKLRFPSQQRVGLDAVIEPEIRGDAFYSTLANLAANPRVRTILEIGASSGAGSTEALVEGALRNPETPAIHTIEISRPRFEQLVRRHADRPFVHAHNMSSVPLEAFPSWEEVAEFHRTVPSQLRRIPIAEVRRWYDQDLRYLQEHFPDSRGLIELKEKIGVETFDLVLLDGCEFTGVADYQQTVGATFMALDDTMSFKNLMPCAWLKAHKSYEVLADSAEDRNGFAAFGPRSRR